MVKQNYIDAAVTEDSDLICYGCPKIIFKLKLDGMCEFLEIGKFTENQLERKKITNESLKCFLA